MAANVLPLCEGRLYVLASGQLVRAAPTLPLLREYCVNLQLVGGYTPEFANSWYQDNRDGRLYRRTTGSHEFDEFEHVVGFAEATPEELQDYYV